MASSTDDEHGNRTEKVVLRSSLGGGPHGVGDPDDKRLRKVENEILIPKKMRDKARSEKCVDESAAFVACCENTGISMVLRCRKENNELKACLTKWYADEDFKRECREQYLEERSEYRRTGISVSMKKKQADMF